MFKATVERLEALQDAVDDEGIILVADTHQVPMCVKIDRLLPRAICLRDINAGWISRHPLNDFLHLKLLEGEDSKVAIVARCNHPVLLALAAHSERHEIVDGTHVEPQNHERVYFVDVVLEVTYYVVEGPVREHFNLRHNTVS